MMSIEYYDRNAVEFFQSTAPLDMSSFYNPFLELIPAGGRILDAGCGSGRDTKAFLERGYTVVAFDASLEMSKLASQHTGINVLHLNFSDMDFHDQFNGIWACSSLLHVTKSDMGVVFQKFLEASRQGAIWYLSFKHGDSERQDEDRIFNDYTAEQLQSLISDFKDLRVIKAWLSEDTRPERQQMWLNALIRVLRRL